MQDSVEQPDNAIGVPAEVVVPEALVELPDKAMQDSVEQPDKATLQVNSQSPTEGVLTRKVTCRTRAKKRRKVDGSSRVHDLWYKVAHRVPSPPCSCQKRTFQISGVKTPVSFCLACVLFRTSDCRWEIGLSTRTVRLSAIWN